MILKVLAFLPVISAQAAAGSRRHSARGEDRNAGPRVGVWPTDPELDVIAVFRELGSATGAEVRERLPDELAYTTVLTVPRTLGGKKLRGARGGGAHAR